MTRAARPPPTPRQSRLAAQPVPRPAPRAAPPRPRRCPACPWARSTAPSTRRACRRRSSSRRTWTWRPSRRWVGTCACAAPQMGFCCSPAPGNACPEPKPRWRPLPPQVLPSKPLRGRTYRLGPGTTLLIGAAPGSRAARSRQQGNTHARKASVGGQLYCASPAVRARTPPCCCQRHRPASSFSSPQAAGWRAWTCCRRPGPRCTSRSSCRPRWCCTAARPRVRRAAGSGGGLRRPCGRPLPPPPAGPTQAAPLSPPVTSLLAPRWSALRPRCRP